MRYRDLCRWKHSRRERRVGVICSVDPVSSVTTTDVVGSEVGRFCLVNGSIDVRLGYYAAKPARARKIGERNKFGHGHLWIGCWVPKGQLLVI